MSSPQETHPRQDTDEAPLESNGFIEDSLSHETEQKEPLDDAKLVVQGVSRAVRRAVSPRTQEDGSTSSPDTTDGSTDENESQVKPPVTLPVLSRRERKQQERDTLAYRHKKIYGSFEPEAGTVSKSERKRQLREMRRGLLTHKLTPAEARAERIRIRALPMDYGESSRRAIGKDYEPKYPLPTKDELLAAEEAARKANTPEADEAEDNQPVIDLGRNELGYLKGAVEQAISEEIGVAEAEHGRKLSRDEFLGISAVTPFRVVREYLGEDVGEQDINTVVELLSKVRAPRPQTARQQSRQEPRSDRRDKKTGRDSGDTEESEESISTEDRERLLALDARVESEIRSRTAGWGTIDDKTFKSRARAVREEIYRETFGDPEMSSGEIEKIFRTVKNLKRTT